MSIQCRPPNCTETRHRVIHCGGCVSYSTSNNHLIQSKPVLIPKPPEPTRIGSLSQEHQPSCASPTPPRVVSISFAVLKTCRRYPAPTGNLAPSLARQPPLSVALTTYPEISNGHCHTSEPGFLCVMHEGGAARLRGVGIAHVVVVVQRDIAQPTADENAAPDMFVVRYSPVFQHLRDA